MRKEDFIQELKDCFQLKGDVLDWGDFVSCNDFGKNYGLVEFF